MTLLNVLNYNALHFFGQNKDTNLGTAGDSHIVQLKQK